MSEERIQFSASRSIPQDDILHHLCTENSLGRCEMDRIIYNESPRVIETRRRLKEEKGFTRIFRKNVLISKR